MCQFKRISRPASPIIVTAGAALAASLLAACSPDVDAGREAELAAAPDTPPAEVAAQPQYAARAALRPTDGHTTSGVVEFTPADSGGLDIRIEIAELTPGMHGFHIHETGDCSAPDASSAGDHYAPDGNPHGAPTDQAHHLGDLGNIEANDEGIAVVDLDSDALTLTGERGIAGRAVVVHAGADDLRSQPSGDAGAPAACGVIERVDNRDLRSANY